MRPLTLAPFVLVALLAPLPHALAGDDATLKALLDKVTSPDIAVRYEARSQAAAAGAPAVLPLAKLIVEVPETVKDERVRREVAITARAALERLVHHAGRPGAEAEKIAVALELAKLLTADQPAKLHREVLHLIAFVGDDAAAPAVARLLDDKDRHVREAARLALERLPGKAAVDALVEASKHASDEGKPDLLFTLGKKGDAAVVPFLLETAARSRGKARLAAFEALARLGAPQAIATFEAALAEPDLPERAQVFNEYLRLADEIAAGGRDPEAAAIARKALAAAPLDHQRERALHRLHSRGGSEALQAALAGLGDAAPRVNQVALMHLKSLEGPEIFPGLKKAYEEAKPEARPSFLRALAEKDRPAAAPLLEEAAKSPQAGLRITALDVLERLGDPGNQALYLETAASGSPQVRPAALKGCLLLARKRLEGGDRARAHEVFARALELAVSDEERGEALRGVIQAEDPRGMAVTEGLLKHPILGAEAARGLVGFAARSGAAGDRDQAAVRLKGIVTGEFPRDVKTRAAEELKKLGRDPQQLAREQGFVVQWHLLTPIQDRDGNGLERKFFPEEVIELDKESRIGERKFVWQKYGDITLDGVIDLIPSFRRSEKVLTYAYTELDSPADREVLFKIGSDDGIACFLNGERIHLKNGSRSLKVDEDTVKAKLRAGKNKILLKIANVDGTWMFAFRVTDPEGKPIASSG